MMNGVDKNFGKLLRPIFTELAYDVRLRMEEGVIKEEDHITGKLFGLMEERINRLAEEASLRNAGLHIISRQFRGRGRNSEESRIGADGAVTLRLNLGGLQIQKSYIFQAKKSTQHRFDNHAIRQRNLMLNCTSDSYFLIFSPKDLKFISAMLIEEGDKYTELPTKSFADFNEDFLNCFIGDHLLDFTDFPPRRLPVNYGPYSYDEAKDNLLIEISEATQ